MVSTEDIPYLGSLLRKVTATQGTAAAAAAGVGPQSEAGTPVPMFDPDVVELNATMLLRFLQVSYICLLIYHSNNDLAVPHMTRRCFSLGFSLTSVFFSSFALCVVTTPIHTLLSRPLANNLCVTGELLTGGWDVPVAPERGSGTRAGAISQVDTPIRLVESARCGFACQGLGRFALDTLAQGPMPYACSSR